MMKTYGRIKEVFKIFMKMNNVVSNKTCFKDHQEGLTSRVLGNKGKKSKPKVETVGEV